MKILAKLLVSFISVAMLCAIVGTVGFTQLSGSEKGIRNLSEQAIPKLDYISRIDRDFRNITTAIRSLVNPLSASDDAYYNAQTEIIAKCREDYADARKKFEALGMTADEKAIYDKLTAQITESSAYNNSLIKGAADARAVSGPARAAIYAELFAKLSGDENKVADDLFTRFEELFAYVQKQYGSEAPKAVLSSVMIGKFVVLGITILAFIVALILGIMQGLSIAGRLRKTVHVLDKISHGDLDERLDIRTSDEFKQVATSLNGVEDNVSALVAETGKLVNSALDGKLAVRADPEAHQGEYRNVIVGINNLLDAVVNPLNMAANYIDNIAKGNMPQKITDQYNGDFNKIKDNLNLAIDSINALIADANMLSEAAVAGALQTRANADRHQGDYRKIVEGVNMTLDLVITPINEIIDIFKRLAEGDLTLRMAGDYKGDFDILKTALNESLESISDTLGQINNAVEQVAEGSVQVSQASQALSQGATEQAASLEEITSSTTEISSQTRQNTENALRMNSLAREAQENAEKGNKQMKELVSAMSDINTSAEEIKKIVKTIDDISFQINLLALNANVEAARAGKYGKGFAVVAEEVRNLAVRSANSVKDTTRMVEEALTNIQKGNSIVDGTAIQLDEIVGGAGQVSTLADEVATAGREQTQGLEQISLGLNQIDQVTQSNTASAEESASASEELSSQAQQVKAMLSRFRIKSSGNVAHYAETITAHEQKNAVANKPGRSPAPSAAPLASPQERAALAAVPPARKKTPVNPAEIISLDDNNFGKF